MYFEGNVAIVDTPGIGDIDQKEVAEETMDYLPNALAFVFVINVAAAGGLQKDRVITICCSTSFYIRLIYIFYIKFLKLKLITD